MSAEREDCLSRMTCDVPGCRKNYEGVEGFTSMVAEARAHGWTSGKVDGKWFNCCPEHSKGL